MTVPVKILLQVGDEEPCEVAEVQVEAADPTARLASGLMSLARYVRDYPWSEAEEAALCSCGRPRDPKDTRCCEACRSHGPRHSQQCEQRTAVTRDVD